MSASFDAYKIFYYVGKYKNITHAAGALFLSQSTVSRSIQSLEADLGCKLMDRSQHGVVLTAEGEMLYGYVARACEEIMHGEERLKLLQSSKFPAVRLGADSFVAANYIFPLVKDFQQDFPKVRIELCSHMLGSHESLTRALLGGEVDAVFTLGPIPEEKDIVSINLCEFSNVFIAGRGRKELSRPNVRLYDVSLQPFGSLGFGAGGSEYLRESFASHGLRVEPSYQVEDFRQLFSLVDMGICLALIPSPLLENTRDYENIFPVSLNASLRKKTICLVTAKATPQNPARDELIKRIKKMMQTHLG